MSIKYPSKELVESLRNRYPEGTRVELLSMSDPYATLQPGDKGTVSMVDDIGTIFVNWDNGSGLGVAYGEDHVRRLEPERTALPGKAESGHIHTGYAIQQSILFDNHRGFALAHNPAAPDPFVTWQFTEKGGNRDFYWGKYSGSLEVAQESFRTRVAEYMRNEQVREIPGYYLRSAELDVEQNYNMVDDGLLNNIEPPKSDLTDGQTYDEVLALAPETLPQEIHSAKDDKPSLLGQLERFRVDSAASKTTGTAKEPEPEL